MKNYASAVHGTTAVSRRSLNKFPHGVLANLTMRSCLPSQSSGVAASGSQMKRDMLASPLYCRRHSDTLSLFIKLGLKCAGTSYFLLLLSGCAGAHLKNVKELADTQPVAPLAIMVTSNVPENSKNRKRLGLNVNTISDSLIKLLKKKNIEAHPVDAETYQVQPGGQELALLINIDRLDPGNPWKSNIIGLGWGKSRLTSHVSLFDERGEDLQKVLAFDVKANNGSMPGILISTGPIGVGLKTAKTVVHLITDDGHEDADRTSKTISNEISKYYASNGWYKPENSFQKPDRTNSQYIAGK